MGILDDLDDLFSDDRPRHPTNAHGFAITYGDDLDEYLVTGEAGAATFTVSERASDGTLTRLERVELSGWLSRYRELAANEVAWAIDGDLSQGVTFIIDRPGQPSLEFTLGDGM